MTDGADDWRRALDRTDDGATWRCLDELLDPKGFAARAAGEFPAGADLWDEAVSRRGFLGLLSATLSLAGAAGCTRAPAGRIVPYDDPPPEVTPGVASHYATAAVRDGYATGLVVESHEGRPTKVEGNPEHPASLGASGLFEQASVLGLYDPSRARTLREGREPRCWDDLVAALATTSGERLHVLMEPTSSPLVASLLDRLRERLPGAQVHFDAPGSAVSAWEGARFVFGRPLEAVVDLRAADVVVALDDDLLGAGPSQLRHARHFADRRRVRSAADGMNRLYVAEASPTVTGTVADHRLRARRAEVHALAAALLAEVAAPLVEGLSRHRAGPARRRWVEAVAADLRAHAGACVVTVGRGQPAEVHALAHLINASLGAFGRTVTLIEPPVLAAGRHGLHALAAALDAGRVDTLLILGGNPAYTAPADLAFARRLRSAHRSVYLGLYENETARGCGWFVPAAHPLEAWGDARAADGTVSFVQPLIAPLHGGRTPAELLAVLLGIEPDAHRLLQDHWRAQVPVDFEAFWEPSVQRGLVPGSASPAVSVAPRWEGLAAWLPGPAAQGFEVGYPLDGRVHDGSFTNNAWLLELPDPVTRLTWENAALLSPATAARLGLGTGDLVEIALHGRRVRAPALVLPGHADESLTLPLGYGRQGAEALARGRGVDAYALRTRDAPAFAVGAIVRRVEGRRALAITQAHWSMEGRAPVREATLSGYRAEPRFAAGEPRRTQGLSVLRPGGAKQWAMAIDLAVCTGCCACVLACQAENNIPVVGREGVLKGREMHWLRIDRYFTGSASDPGVAVQPMLCQHCEHAPCEYVCPVNATVHSPDGLNEQVYNRCVGTRYCSNNCPYKVRRFNYLDYHRGEADEAHLAMNPDVTVRARGVMEKCSYCVQRIRRAGLAERSGAAGSALQTACQQACPTRAIEFGSLTDPGAPVAALHRNERAYSVLDELGTAPRTRYLARLRNPNPALESP
jgi:molybdopterin-containing oxidoreductase family iron-sulfur binding subunit